MSQSALIILLFCVVSLIVLPFYFAKRPNYNRLFLFFGVFIISFAIITNLHIFTNKYLIGISFIYSLCCYFILTFLFQNNTYLFYANLIGITIGYEGLSIPVILWSSSDDFVFVNILGIPIWRPFTYIRMLRHYYDKISALDFYNQSNAKLISNKKQLFISKCKFSELIRINSDEKYGSCFLVFSTYEKDEKYFITYADRSLLQIKPIKDTIDNYKVAYIKRAGIPPKLNKTLLYDIFGTFYYDKIDDKEIPTVYLRGIRRHDRYFLPNLLPYWLCTMLLLCLSIILYLIVPKYR